MAKIVTSARGEKVDFDLIGIKNAMAALPVNDNVKKRERFINKRRRRGLKRRVDEMAQTKRLEEANFASVTESLVDVTEVDATEDVVESDDTTKTKTRRKVK